MAFSYVFITICINFGERSSHIRRSKRINSKHYYRFIFHPFYNKVRILRNYVEELLQVRKMLFLKYVLKSKILNK